jgi:hypothetical protein
MKSRQFLTCRPNLLICVNLHPRFMRKIILPPGCGVLPYRVLFRQHMLGSAGRTSKGLRETSENTESITYAPGRLKCEVELLRYEVSFQKQQGRQSNEPL